jgi:hypothetical protein
MSSKRALVINCLAAAAMSIAWPAVSAAARGPCELPAAGAAGGASPDDATHASALANWDVRGWQRHRIWITLQADNRGDAEARVLPLMALAARADAGATTGLAGLPMTLAPHAHATQRMTVYVPDDTRTLGLRLVPAAPSPAPDVAATFALECSDARFDPGQVAAGVAPLLQEALSTWFDGFVDPLDDARAALKTAGRLAAGAQDGSDVVWALRGLMQALGDGHGFALAAGEPLPARRALVTRAPAFEWLPDGVAVVRLHPVDTADPAAALAWAAALHDGVGALARRHPRGWIVDLRDLDGDSPWAAFAGLSTLLDGPVVGATVSRHDSQQWIVERGAARVAGAPAAIDLQAAPEPSFPGPVAVLVGPGTRDAGEDVAVAFEGRARTRFFGAPTAGFPLLGVRVHTLSDGSRLGVLELRDADRTGVVHRQAIEPDVPVHADTAGDVPAAALEWLQGEQGLAAQ